jgi:hypothetical protein
MNKIIFSNLSSTYTLTIIIISFQTISVSEIDWCGASLEDGPYRSVHIGK